jgi:hypothetical protein
MAENKPPQDNDKPISESPPKQTESSLAQEIRGDLRKALGFFGAKDPDALIDKATAFFEVKNSATQKSQPEAEQTDQVKNKPPQASDKPVKEREPKQTERSSEPTFRDMARKSLELFGAKDPDAVIDEVTRFFDVANTTTEKPQAEAPPKTVVDEESEPLESEEQPPNIFEIVVPRNTQWQPNVAGAMMSAIYDHIAHKWVILEIRATHKRIRWIVAWEPGVGAFTQQSLTSLINQFYPGSQVREYYVTEDEPLELPLERRFCAFRADVQTGFEHFANVNDFRRDDPLTLMVQTINNLEAGEEVTFTLVVERPEFISPEDRENFLYPTAHDMGVRMQVQAPTYISGGKNVAGEVTGALVGFGIRKVREARANQKLKKERVRRFADDKTHNYYEAKLSKKMAVVAFGVSIDTPKPARRTFLTAITNSVQSVSAAGDAKWVAGEVVDKRVETEEDFGLINPINFAAQQFQETGGMDLSRVYSIKMTADEVAALWHLPNNQHESRQVSWASNIASDLVMEGAGDDPDKIPIGVVEGTDTVIALSRPDRRYHTYITGMTGHGKTNLMEHLIYHDMVTGQGVAVIDPKGTLVKDIIRHGIPDERRRDVLLLECGTTDYPVPLNPFKTQLGIDEEETFETVLWMMKSIYKAEWSQTRMETVLRNALQAVLTDPDATPLDVQSILVNPQYRRNLLQKLEAEDRLSQSSTNWWTAFEQMAPSAQRNHIDPVLSRLNTFLSSPTIEAMMCHPHPIDFRRVIDHKKILLVDLSGNKIKSEVGPLGAVLLAQFYLTSLALGEIPGNANPRFYLYVDEVSELVTSPIPDMFSKSRQFGLCMNLANQYIGQLDSDTLAGVRKNVGTTVSFNCEPDEARLTHQLYEPDVTIEQMTKLDVGVAAMKTRAGGKNTPAFLVRAFPPFEEVAGESEFEYFRAQTRDTLKMMTRQEVRRWIKERAKSDVYNKPVEGADNLTDFD